MLAASTPVGLAFLNSQPSDLSPFTAPWQPPKMRLGEQLGFFVATWEDQWGPLTNEKCYFFHRQTCEVDQQK
jgi:hypothetical protein